MNFFFRSRPDTSWVPVGPASSFPDLGDDAGNLIQSRASCDGQPRPGCKVLHVPKQDPALASEVFISPESTESPSTGDQLTDQVLVFRYRGKFHAVDHRCPHSAFPLSNGSPFDIEDFGVILSAGLTCPKHGWSFDLITGMSDRAQYKLPVWEVQLRDKDGAIVANPKVGEDEIGGAERTVWVRKKPRMG